MNHARADEAATCAAERGVPVKQLLRPPKGNYGVDGGSSAGYSDEKEAGALAMREHRMSYA